MTQLCAVLLDIDGTLVDSTAAHARSWTDAVAEAGLPVPSEHDARRLVGMGADHILPRLAPGLDPEGDEAARLRGRVGELFRERHLPGVRAFPAVRELLLRMRGEGLRLVAASSARRENVGHLLEIAGVADLIEASTSSSDVERSKPEPDIIEAALEKSGCASRDSALMLGDTPYDIEAARRAGVGCVVLRCGGHGCWRDANLAGAVALYDDPADLLARFVSSPFAAARL